MFVMKMCCWRCRIGYCEFEMDLSGATKILLDRIQKLEPEIATKIIGCILIQDHGEREMIRLAYAPEKLLENLVQKTKLQLEFLAKPQLSTSMSPPISIHSPPVAEVSMNPMLFSSNGSRPYLSPLTFRVPPSHWDLSTPTPEQQQILSSDYLSFGDSIVGYDDQLDPVNARAGCFNGDMFYNDATLRNLSMGRNHNVPSLMEFPVKTCHYFNLGICKHGNSCRNLHGQVNVSQLFSSLELGADDHLFSPGSLEKLEVEISELLKSVRGLVSIASLPMLYVEKYGRMLRAEGYLTESQRHGRAGFSLTKLLDRLKTVRLIDRPHGQHSVILAEDALKYNLEHRSERNDPGSVAIGSRQIYLTFPAESTFTDEDVSDYFREFGTVEDVRIPCQQKRMFGFVTFASASIVKTVLATGNPHFICGSRVLVKPYREKSKLVNRKYMDKNDHAPRFEAPRFLRRQLMERHERAIEMERWRLSEFHSENIHNPEFIGYSMDELKSFEDASNFTSAAQYHYLLDVINNTSVTDDRPNHRETRLY